MNRRLASAMFAVLMGCWGVSAQDAPAPQKPASYAERLNAKRKELDTTHQRQALARMEILMMLHDGKTAEAIDSLETVLDGAICTSRERASTYSGEARESELKFLRQMKEYRQKYPREKKDETADKARSILAELQ